MKTFRAGVQYGDWEGTAAADDTVPGALFDYLKRSEKYDASKEFLIAADLYSGTSGHLGINAFVVDVAGADAAQQKVAKTPDPLPVRCIRIDLSIEEFIALFGRFNIVLTRRGFNLEGREYQCLPTDDGE